MSMTPKVFDISVGTQLTFRSDVSIKGLDYVAVYVSTTGLTNSYTRVSYSDYSLIEDSIVFNIAPIGLLLRLEVSTTRSELLNTPSNTAEIVAFKYQLQTIVDNLEALLDTSILLDSITPKVEVTDFIVKSSALYLVDTTIEIINVTIENNINMFTIGDYDSTWSDSNQVLVDLGTDVITFGLAESNKKYTFVKEDNTWRVYDALGTFKIKGNI